MIVHINGFNEHSQEPYSISTRKSVARSKIEVQLTLKKQFKNTLKIPDAIVPGKDNSKFRERGLVTLQYVENTHRSN